MTRGPFKLETREMDEVSRLDWWNRNGGQVEPRGRILLRLSLVWKAALRQEWGIG